MQKNLRWKLVITVSPAVLSLLIWSSLFMPPMFLSGPNLVAVVAAAVITSLLVGYCIAAAALVTADYFAHK